jgi:uncharacterized protein (DUF1697 family)
MTTYVALLRGINVGGKNKVAMADLREFLAGLGLDDAKTLLQSGNVVFRSQGKTAGALEKFLEKESAARLGVSADYVIRSAAEWAKVIEANPFPNEAQSDPSHLVVMFLKSTPTPASVKAVQASIKGREIVKSHGRELYLVYPDGIGTSKLTGTLIEWQLGLRGTARNWNTVLKLGALAED